MPKGRQAGTPKILPKVVTDIGTGVGPARPPEPEPEPAPAPEPAPPAVAPRARTASLPPMPMDEVGELARHVRVGLLRRPRVLPSRWMFDEVGAALYDAWTHLPENGIARAELRLLHRNAPR